MGRKPTIEPYHVPTLEDFLKHFLTEAETRHVEYGGCYGRHCPEREELLSFFRLKRGRTSLFPLTGILYDHDPRLRVRAERRHRKMERDRMALYIACLRVLMPAFEEALEQLRKAPHGVVHYLDARDLLGDPFAADEEE